MASCIGDSKVWLPLPFDVGKNVVHTDSGTSWVTWVTHSCVSIYGNGSIAECLHHVHTYTWNMLSFVRMHTCVCMCVCACVLYVHSCIL